MPMLPLIIGAGMGLLQSSEQAQQEAAQRKTAAATIAYSPWTGANINQAQSAIHPATPISDIGQGLIAGARYNQGGYGPNGGNTVNNAVGTSAADSFKGLSSAQGGSPYMSGSAPDLQAPSADKKISLGGEYGFGPAPGQQLQSTYGPPWPANSPNWGLQDSTGMFGYGKANPYGGS